MSKKNKNATITQQFSLVLYDEEDLKLLLTYNVKRYAYIWHSPEPIATPVTPENAELAEFELTTEQNTKRHCHIFISFNSPRRIGWLDFFKMLYRDKIKQNIFCQKCTSVESIITYFTHIKQPHKIQYSTDDIVRNFPLKIAELVSDKNTMILENLKTISRKGYGWTELLEENPNLIFSVHSLTATAQLLQNDKLARQYSADTKRKEMLALIEQKQIDDFNNILDHKRKYEDGKQLTLFKKFQKDFNITEDGLISLKNELNNLESPFKK